jgi:hypothetical protein
MSRYPVPTPVEVSHVVPGVAVSAATAAGAPCHAPADTSNAAAATSTGARRAERGSRLDGALHTEIMEIGPVSSGDVTQARTGTLAAGFARSQVRWRGAGGRGYRSTMSTPQGGDLAAEFAELARRLQWQKSPLETWQQIVGRATEAIEGCDMAAITLVTGRTVRTAVATDSRAEEVDRIQYATGQGPCLDSLGDQDMFITSDLLAEARWPEFSRIAAEQTGVRSMLAFRLFVQEDTLGALNLTSFATGAFTEHARTVGALFAAHAALAMAGAQDRQTVSDLETALDSSRSIGMAVGMLMESRQVDRHTAFRILSGASQRNNVKVGVLAKRIVTAHDQGIDPAAG